MGSVLNNPNFSFFSEKIIDNGATSSVPSLYIPDEEIDESICEWNFSLIGRLDFVKFKFVVAEESLRKQWKLTGDYQLIPLGKGFFIIKLSNEKDMKYIWNGWWKNDSQILKLRLWEPNFNPAAQKTTTAFVWVNFPGLVIKYWKEKILMSLGDAIGRAIKVDETSLKREVGYYASVLVEVDLANKVHNQVLVKTKYGSFEQEVHIPKIPSFCSHCKVVGHLITECRVQQKEQKHLDNVGTFHILQSLENDEFPPLSVNKLLDVATSSTSVINKIKVGTGKEQGTQEVVKKVVKPKNISFITTRKNNGTNLVKEKKGVRSHATSQSQPSI
ncbi:uncharacterized protein LOC113334259 [Papaver somniferum]|uniref:uncharacterized protein LOC113334259 n=1 Tax=Papaver somniferum TaxID=3469 RepID=UPI000E70174D|nr:uncharacterized protein LOC113334259 [Papaver somniferum]